MTKTSLVALIALGSNGSEDITDNAKTVLAACRHIEIAFGDHIKKSRFYQTPAFPKGNGPDFINAAIAVKTAELADDILAKLHSIENEMGRTRQHRWEQRVIDLDLIALGQHVLPDRAIFESWRNMPPADQLTHTPSELLLPHPRMQDRAFVLGPLMDIAPDWEHPVLGLSVAEMWNALPRNDREELRTFVLRE